MPDGASARAVMPPSDEEIEVELLRLARTRRATFCPSEAARGLAGDWRPLMGPVRATAARLVSDGRLRATRKGEPVDPATARGPIRLGAS